MMAMGRRLLLACSLARLPQARCVSGPRTHSLTQNAAHHGMTLLAVSVCAPRTDHNHPHCVGQVVAWVRVIAGDAERSDEFEREVLSAINPALAVVGFWGATLEKVSEKRSSSPTHVGGANCGLVGLWAGVVMLVGGGAHCPQGTLKAKKKRQSRLLVLEWGSRMYDCVW
jgi:hypothetical protein